MNSLSWTIYFADIVGSVGGLLCTIAVFGLFAGGIALLMGDTVFRYPPTTYSWEDREQKQKVHDEIGKALTKYGALGLKIGLPAALITAFLPSKNTVYAIAASQVGEQVIYSKTGEKALKALDAWLDRQISPAADKQEK